MSRLASSTIASIRHSVSHFYPRRSSIDRIIRTYHFSASDGLFFDTFFSSPTPAFEHGDDIYDIYLLGDGEFRERVDW